VTKKNTINNTAKTSEERMEELYPYAFDILAHENFRKMDGFLQHGETTVAEHSLCVADTALQLSRVLPVRFNRRELVRGALLHDYFLYDWHKHDEENQHPSWHGFRHPKIALRNAQRDFPLSETEREIIRTHMWPLTVTPPAKREAWVVTAADKLVSTRETAAGLLLLAGMLLGLLLRPRL